MNINAVCFHGCIILLDFTGELDGTSDVPAVQVELWVEVLLSCDGCGVVRTGTLGHITLTEKYRESYKLPCSAAGGVGGCAVHCGDSYPIVSSVLFSNPQEGLQRSL